MPCRHVLVCSAPKSPYNGGAFCDVMSKFQSLSHCTAFLEVYKIQMNHCTALLEVYKIQMNRVLGGAELVTGRSKVAAVEWWSQGDQGKEEETTTKGAIGIYKQKVDHFWFVFCFCSVCFGKTGLFRMDLLAPTTDQSAFGDQQEDRFCGSVFSGRKVCS